MNQREEKIGFHMMKNHECSGFMKNRREMANSFTLSLPFSTAE